MKTFKVNTQSFSYRWNEWLWWNAADVSENSRPRDFCTYWRHTLIYSTLIAAFFTLMTIAGIIAVITLLYAVSSNIVSSLAGIGAGVLILLALYLYIEYASSFVSKYVMIALTFIWNHGLGAIMRFIFVPIGASINWLFVKIGDGCIWLSAKIRSIIPTKSAKTTTTTIDTSSPEDKEPGWLMQRYLSLKGQYCPMIEYTQPE